MSAECSHCGSDIAYPEGSWPVGECPTCTRDAELADLRAWGDQMQSESSRLAEWAREVWDDDPDGMPYEVGMATVAVQGLVDRWTEMRSK